MEAKSIKFPASSSKLGAHYLVGLCFQFVLPAIVDMRIKPMDAESITKTNKWDLQQYCCQLIAVCCKSIEKASDVKFN
jgi:hypothetical protein